VPHGVPEGRERGGAAPRRLRRSQAETHGSRGQDRLRLPRRLTSGIYMCIRTTLLRFAPPQVAVAVPGVCGACQRTS
jgi:hypothetical protein